MDIVEIVGLKRFFIGDEIAKSEGVAQVGASRGRPRLLSIMLDRLAKRRRRQTSAKSKKIKQCAAIEIDGFLALSYRKLKQADWSAPFTRLISYIRTFKLDSDTNNRKEYILAANSAHLNFLNCIQSPQLLIAKSHPNPCPQCNDSAILQMIFIMPDAKENHEKNLFNRSETTPF